jgi:thioredoxin reductase (NADPH)
MTKDQPLDAVVIGGGPGGLVAALYLARFGRNFLVLDAGESRAAWIPTSHNQPGFPKGVSGPDLLKRLKRHARRYGAVIKKACVDTLEFNGDGFDIRAGKRRYCARTVLMATGVIDNEPKLPGLERAIARGLIRICPICDGHEARGQVIGVIGNSAHGVREALFLRTYSDDVTLIHVGEPGTLAAADRRALAAASLPVIETPIQAVRIERNLIAAFTFEGRPHNFDTVYSGLGSTPRSKLAQQAGAKLDEQGRLIVDDHQNTSVAGLYAAGDLVRGLNQITVAEAEAAIAATDIHNRLRTAGSGGLFCGFVAAQHDLAMIS